MKNISIESLQDRSPGFNPYLLKWGQSICIPTTRSLPQYGHAIYNRYPARSTFIIPRAIIFHYLQNSLSRPVRILDPFMGSGTTAVEAALSSACKIFGAEMDPFARMIAEVSVNPLSENEVKEVTYHLDNICKLIDDTDQLDTGQDPIQSFIPNLRGIEGWFNSKEFEGLCRAKSYIAGTQANDSILKFLKVTLADAVKPSSLAERQSLKLYRSRKHPKTPLDLASSLRKSLKKHLLGLSQYPRVTSQNINWVSYDATNFQTTEPLNLVITSPPYINALDYSQVIKLDSAWAGFMDDDMIKYLKGTQVGHDHRRSNKITDIVQDTFLVYYTDIINSSFWNEGHTPGAIKKCADTCLSYFNDMYHNLVCTYNSLAPGGEYHIIIGDNVIKGVQIPTHLIIADLAKQVGFTWFQYYKYPIRDHRTSIPRNGQGGKIEFEFVISFRR